MKEFSQMTVKICVDNTYGIRPTAETGVYLGLNGSAYEIVSADHEKCTIEIKPMEFSAMR